MELERQVWSLRDILLQDPELDTQAAAADLQQRLQAALGHDAPGAGVSIRLERDWLAVDVDPGSSDSATRSRLLAALAEAKGAWYRDLLAATAGAGTEGPRPGPLATEQ